MNVSELVQLDASGSSDANNDPLSYFWSLLSVPSGSSATLDNTALVHPGFTADVSGTYIGQLIVNDAVTESDADTIVITTENSRPVAEAGADQTVYIGSQVTLSGQASSDADSDTLTYQWSLISRPDASTAILNNSTSVDTTLTMDVSGSYVVQLVVNDGALSSAPDTVLLTTTDQPLAGVDTIYLTFIRSCRVS